MKTRYTVALSMIAGAALGAVAIQGLHAQAKKVYLVSEADILDKSAVSAWNAAVRPAMSKAGMTNAFSSERIVSVIGTAPERFSVTEFPSVEKAQAWLNSPERKALAPQRDKTLKFTKQFIVEGQ